MKEKSRNYILGPIMLVVVWSMLLVAPGQARGAGPFRFVSWADTKSDRDILSELSDQAVLLNPAFTIYEGDLESSGFTSSGMNAWKEAMDGELTGDTSPNGMFDIVFPVRGNHDDGNTAGWQNYFDFQATANFVGATNYTYMPGEEDLTYSFDYENAHFIGVDVPGDAGGITTAQIQWIDDDLAAAEARGLSHAFIYFHGPIYCVDGHCSCSQRIGCIDSSVESLIEVLNQHPIVSATFHGHEHTYAYTYIDETRVPAEGSFEGVTHPFHQFITGSAGAGPSSCDGDRCDYNMAENGFVTVDVEGQNVTVTFYQLGSMVPVYDVRFTNDWGGAQMPPTANDDSVSTPVNTEVTIDVATNDSDPNGNLDLTSANTTCTGCSDPTNGNLVNNGDGSFTYTPGQDYQGLDSFVYEICDTDPLCDTATVSITVTPPNDPPLANDDSVSTAEDTAETIDVTANDSDPDGNLDPATVNTVCTGCADPGNGSLVNNSDGTFDYMPNPDFNGSDSFVYEVCDSFGLCDTATVTITVDPVADPPTANDDSASTPDDTAVTIYVTANDTDPDGNLDPTTANTTCATCAEPVNGLLINNGGGRFDYTPDPGFSGLDSFVYEICDTDALCDTATVSITVNSPIVIVDAVSSGTTAGASLSISHTTSGTDRLMLVGVSINNDNLETVSSITYNGIPLTRDGFVDHQGSGGDDSRVEIWKLIDPPLGTYDVMMTLSADLRHYAVVGVITFSGVDQTDPLGAFAASYGDSSSPSLSVPSEPDELVLGVFACETCTSVSFSSPGVEGWNLLAGGGNTIGAGASVEGASPEMTVNVSLGKGDHWAMGGISIKSAGIATPPNYPPVANDDSDSTAEDTPVAIDVATNDTDPDGNLDPTSANEISGPSNGTLINDGNGSFTYTPDQDFNGTDSFVYQICDDLDACDTATVTLTVSPVNDAPVADAQSVTTAENNSVAITLTGSDVDGDSLTYSVVSVPANGTLGGTAPNLTYQPNPGFIGPDSCTFRVNDGTVDSNVATVSITVTEVNNPPVANTDSAITDEDTVVNIDVLANDTDVDDDSLTVSSVSQGTNGTVVVNADNTVTYTPNTNYNGTDNFTYAASDGIAQSDPATVTLTVSPVNDAPVADAQSVTTAENNSVAITLTGSDVDGDSLTYSIYSDPANGTVNGTAPNIIYQPNTNFTGSDSFVYEICDTGPLCDTATVDITVDPVADPPVANDDSASTPEDTPVSIDVAANDTDPDNNLDPSSVNTACAGCADAGNGSLVNNGNGSFTFSPNADFTGSDSFVYEICDLGGLCDTATVDITIDPVADPPVANNDSANCTEATPVTLDLAANDSDPDGNLNPASANTTCGTCTDPTNGSLVNHGDGRCTYTPDPGFYGQDSFVYEVCDTDPLCDTATVSITVNPSAPTTFEVRVAARSDDAEERSSGSMYISSSDLELVYDKSDQQVGIRFSGIEIPQGATIANAYIQFQVDETHSGATSLTIQGEAIDDAPTFTSSSGNISSRDKTSAAVSWDPVPWTTRGEAGPDQRTPDIASVIQEIVSRTGWSNGNSLVIIITGTGERVAESYNGDQSGAPLLHVEFTTGPPNQPPTAYDDSASTFEDTPVAINVAANDTDPEGNLDAGSANEISGPSYGTLVNDGDGSCTYTPDPDFNGTDSFVYQICDTLGACDTAAVDITVDPVADPPVANDDSAGTSENTAVIIDVAANDSDPDGNLDPTSAGVTTIPNNGTVVNSGNGLFQYTPNPGLNGSDSFVYEICDSGTPRLCDTATVNITVTPTNDPPVANDDSASIQEDTVVTIDVAANDSDPDNNLDPGSVNTACAGCADAGNGSLVNNGDGSFLYSPNADFNGADSFVYQVCDDLGACDTATVTIIIDPVADSPEANDDLATTTEDTPITIDVAANDSDPEGNLNLTSASVTSGPTNGSVVNNGNGSFTYSPDSGFSGSDSFAYEICDEGGLCDMATVSITVNPSAVSVDAVSSGTTAGSSLSITHKTSGTNRLMLVGVSINNDNFETVSSITYNGVSLTYVNSETQSDDARVEIWQLVDPPAGTYDVVITFSADLRRYAVAGVTTFSGVDQADPLGTFAGNNATSSSANVTVPSGSGELVLGVFSCETCSSVTFSSPAGEQWNLIAGGGNEIGAGSTMEGESPQVTINASLSASDHWALGGVSIRPGSSGAPNNDPPVANGDTASTPENTAVTIDVAANDSDPDGNLDPTTANTACPTCEQPSYGSLVNNGDGSFDYTPDPGFIGTDSFLYEICDTESACDTASVSITVGTVADPPTANNDPVTTTEDTPITIDVAANDTDPDGNLDPTTANTTCGTCAGPAYGTLANNGDGSFTYTPDPGFSGSDSFVYEICDSGALCDTATVSITVTTASTIRVPEDYPSIQAAINAAQEGDVVLVSPGTYNGSLTLDKAVTLTSWFFTTGDEAHIASTILDGGGGSSVIDIPAGTPDRPTIMGLTIQNSTDGVFPSAKFDFLHNVVRDTSDGIDYESGSGGLCQFNVFEMNSDDGIDLDGSVDIVIADNIIRNNGDDGIEKRLHAYSGPTLNIIIRNNVITGNDEDGIQLIDYADLSDRVILIERNLIANNTMVGLGLMDNGDTSEDFRAASIPERIYVFNNTFTGNPHGLTGGDNLIALNNLFVNSTNLAMKNVDGNSIAAYNLFWNNGTDQQGSNLDLAYTLFANPLLDSEFRLQSGSPAIDAGTYFFQWQGETVMDMPDTEFFGAAPDLGAYESNF